MLGILLIAFVSKGVFAEEVNDSIDVNNSGIVLNESFNQYNLLVNGYYKIVNSTDKTALESNGYIEDLDVSFNEMNDNSNQIIYLEKQNDESYTITFYNNKLVVALEENNKLIQQKFNNSDKQKWLLYQNHEGDILLKNKYTDNFIDIQRNKKTINDQSNLTFNISPILTLTSEPYVAEVPNGLYKIQSVLSGRNLEIYAGSLDNGGLLSQWSNNGYNKQVFEVQNTETGSYIVSTESQKALDIGSYNDGTKIIQVDKKINISQRFKLNKSKTTSGEFNIESNGGTVFDVQYSSNGSQLVLRNVNNTAYQDFNFIATALEKPYPRKVTSKILNVPAIGQLPELPTGCEITAITMMFQHSGANVDKISMAYKMPYHNWDPNYGYVGSPFYRTGWTIYPPALTGLVGQYTGSSYNMTGRSIADIENQIINNKAVVVWASDFHGFTVHAITITGFDESVLYYNDPWTGAKNNSIYKSYFNQVWAKQSKRAISY